MDFEAGASLRARFGNHLVPWVGNGGGYRTEVPYLGVGGLMLMECLYSEVRMERMVSRVGKDAAMSGLNARTKGPSPGRVAREMISRLRRMRDRKRAGGVQQYFKHEIVALGITTPALRVFVRDRVRGIPAGGRHRVPGADSHSDPRETGEVRAEITERLSDDRMRVLQRALYTNTTARLEILLKDAHLDWFHNYLGERPQAIFTATAGLLNGGSCYGSRCQDATGREQL